MQEGFFEACSGKEMGRFDAALFYGKEREELKRKGIFQLLLMVLLGLFLFGAAAEAAPSKVKISCRKNLTMKAGEEKMLKISTNPAGAKLVFTSKNPEVVKVGRKGKVTALKSGKAKIIVKAKKTNGLASNEKVIKVKVSGCMPASVTRSGSRLKVTAGALSRTYTAYMSDYPSNGSSYYPAQGCVVTGLAVAASGFGSTCSQVDIHEGSESSVCSERYALKKMGLGSSSWSNSLALSMTTASQVLTDLKIKNKLRCTYTESQAVRELTEWAQALKPVIIKCHNTPVNGVQIANSHHTLVLLGIDKNGKGIFYDSATGNLNYAHTSKNYFSCTIAQMVRNYMRSSSYKPSYPYVTDSSSAFGYILVG